MQRCHSEPSQQVSSCCYQECCCQGQSLRMSLLLPWGPGVRGSSKHLHREELKALIMWKLRVAAAGGTFPAPRHSRTAFASGDSAASVLASRVPGAERFRTVCKGHRAGISTPAAENQVVSRLVKSGFLKDQPTAVLYFCSWHSSGACTPSLGNPGQQLDGRGVTYRWANTRTHCLTLGLLSFCLSESSLTFNSKAVIPHLAKLLCFQVEDTGCWKHLS